MSFTALDFETANSDRASVCAVGAVRVRDGVVVDTFRSLVRPPAGYADFERINVSIHGITAEGVAGASDWPTVFTDLMAFAGSDVIVAHNAAFDMSVLLNACGVMDIDWPELDSFCTMRLAKAVLTVPSYSLPWVVDHLGLGVFDHHDPLADARASAQVLVSLARRLGVDSIAELSERTAVQLSRTIQDQSEPILSTISSNPDPVLGSGFEGDFVCFTGTLKTMVRETAQQLITEHGGTPQNGVTKKTSILVTGDFDTQTFKPGASFTSKLQKAFDKADSGQRLEILTEDAFVARLSLREEELRQYVSRFGGQRSQAPDYVIEQAQLQTIGVDYWTWFRKSLAHPLGRASGGEECVWCERFIESRAHWVYRDRHVCSASCNEKLKRSAKRKWARNGLSGPSAMA